MPLKKEYKGNIPECFKGLAQEVPGYLVINLHHFTYFIITHISEKSEVYDFPLPVGKPVKKVLNPYCFQFIFFPLHNQCFLC